MADLVGLGLTFRIRLGTTPWTSEWRCRGQGGDGGWMDRWRLEDGAGRDAQVGSAGVEAIFKIRRYKFGEEKI